MEKWTFQPCNCKRSTILISITAMSTARCVAVNRTTCLLCQHPKKFKPRNVQRATLCRQTAAGACERASGRADERAPKSKVSNHSFKDNIAKKSAARACASLLPFPQRICKNCICRSNLMFAPCVQQVQERDEMAKAGRDIFGDRAIDMPPPPPSPPRRFACWLTYAIMRALNAGKCIALRILDFVAPPNKMESNLLNQSSTNTKSAMRT